MDETRQYLSFYLESHLYGIDIRLVKEVNPTTKITPVPRSKGHVRGLVNIRGQVILVMDIAVMFGREPRPITGDSQIVVLKTAQEIKQIRDFGALFDVDRFNDKPVGFLVDQIGDVITVDATEVKPAPPHLAEANAGYVEGVVRQEDRLLIPVNVAEMV